MSGLQHERIMALCERLKLARLQRRVAGAGAGGGRAERGELRRLPRVQCSPTAEIGRPGRAAGRRRCCRLATMPAVKTLEQFDWGQAGGAPKAQILELAHLAFVERAQNGDRLSDPVEILLPTGNVEGRPDAGDEVRRIRRVT